MNSPIGPQPKRSFRNALETAETEEKVRGFIALLLVLVLLALVFKTPDAIVTEPVIASTKTLAISVIAFYFGLHKGTPQGKAKAKAEAVTSQSSDTSTTETANGGEPSAAG